MNNVLSRPLFRQAGGSILPPNSGLNVPPANPVPMPPAMPPVGGPGVSMPPVGGPNPAMAAQNPIEQAEMEAGAEMEKVGAEYMSGVFSGIDNAETAEDLINALRGDDRPIQSRYQELAMIVGPEDASNTPDSVLALAQPGIMMAMPEVDSGIGMLVEDLTAGAEMVTPEGAPTDMGQGVGGLMMAGAGPMDAGPPPVGGMPMGGAPMPMGPEMGGAPQYLAYGGPVIKKFDLGGGANANEPPPLYTRDMDAEMNAILASTAPAIGIKAQYEQLRPLYENLVGSSDASRKAQGRLAIAKAALDWGSGKYAGQGRSPFAQGAGAISDTLPTLSALSAQRDKEKQAVSLAALKGASDLESAARTGQREIALERIKQQYPFTKTLKGKINVQETVSRFMDSVRKRQAWYTEKGEKDVPLFSTTKPISAVPPEKFNEVEDIVDLVVATKFDKEEGKLVSSLTGDEIDLILEYLKALPEGDNKAISTEGLIAHLIEEGKVKYDSLPPDIQNREKVERAQKKFLNFAEGGAVQKFKDGSGVSGYEELEAFDKKAKELFDVDPEDLEGIGDPAQIIGASNIWPSIVNVGAQALGQKAPYPEQIQATQFYRNLVEDWTRATRLHSGDLLKKYGTPAADIDIAKELKVAWPKTGSFWPGTWREDAALEAIRKKREDLVNRIDVLRNQMAANLGREEQGLTDTQLGDIQAAIPQLESILERTDRFLLQWKRNELADPGKAAARRAAQKVNESLFNDPPSSAR